MSFRQTRVVTHSQKVCRLYKKSLRAIEDYKEPDRALVRYEQILMRQRFEVNRNIQDLRVARKLLEEGEKEYEQKKHWEPKYFPSSPNGAAYMREYIPDDHILDYWHPLEKAMFPDYFAKREQRKKDYVEFYRKMYGGDAPPKAEPLPIKKIEAK